MSVLRSLEEKIAGLVEGTFGRVFRSEVRPVELARKLAREMDEHRTQSVSRTYVPNEYTVWLGREDRERFADVEHEISEELAGYLLEHARRERYALVSTPKIDFETDDALALGEFGIQARLVRPGVEEAAARPARPAAPEAPFEQAESGHTMIYSASDRHRDPLADAQGARQSRAFAIHDGARHLLPSEGAVLGRSREADIVIDDANVSRRHAELRPGPQGWTVADLGSTTGVKRNGKLVGSGAASIAHGDTLELGTALVRFEVE